MTPDCHHNQTTAEEKLLSVEMCVTTSQKYFSSSLLITCFHIWHSPGGTHITATRHWERSTKAFYIDPSILSPKTGCKGMTQHPAAAGILYWLSCPPIGRERQALLLVNLPGSCYWVEVDATNEAVEIPFLPAILKCHCYVEEEICCQLFVEKLWSTLKQLQAFRCAE